MDPQVSTSFIPKKPLAEARGSGGGVYGLFFLIALLIFITSLVAAGGAFLYGRYLSVALDSKKAQLTKYEQAYDLPTIQTLVRYDSRINEAHKILRKHLSPSAVFYFLSQETLEKVQFTSFSFNSSGKDNAVEIRLSGMADGLDTVALQSDQLGASKVLRDVIFSGITIQPKGKVGFDVTAKVDPALILFSNNLTANPLSQTTPVDQSSSASTTLVNTSFR